MNQSQAAECIEAERDNDGHLVEDAWVCVCGNRSDLLGFHPCDREGREVEPDEAHWPDPLYRCDECGRIILQSLTDEDATRWVVGRRA